MKTVVVEAKQCPKCGRLLPGGVLTGLCPACLLAQGAETDDPGRTAPFQAPPLDEIARLFPQLEIISLLGAGGMGAVYKARQPALDRFVALKILPAANNSGANFAERFNREARALARLSHPNIVAVHEFGQAGALHYFLMEFVDGANLRQLERAAVLSPREALQIIPQICDALQYAHDQGVVHRDIKPENVLVDRKGRVKIADFGLAKIAGAQPDSSRLTVEGQVMGTPHYMAPEQVERPLAVDHRADIYALGVVFYEMLTGDLPIGKFSPPSRKVQVDVRFDEVVLRALENDPERRYQNASEVKSQVETIATTPQVATAPAPQADRQYLSWLGFAVVVERDGKRQANWKGVVVAMAVMFGLLTIAFGFVSAVTGGSAWRLIGVVGWPSVVVRLVISAAAVGWGVRRALHSKARPEALPQTPRGTVILPSARRHWRIGRRIVFASLLVLVWSVFQFQWLTPWLRAPARKLHAAQVAVSNPSTRTLVAKLPGRGSVELLAIGDRNAALNGWWSPDGTPISNVLYEVRGPVEYQLTGQVSKDILLRARDLPNDATSAGVEAWPVSGSGSGGEVFRDGKRLSGAFQVRMGWEPSVHTASIFVGYGLEPWRTIGAHAASSQSHGHVRLPNDPNWTLNFHHTPADTKDGAQIAVIFGPEDRMWRHRMIAVGTNGIEYTSHNANGTPIEKLMLWTFTFHQLPLSAVKEFRFQVRPVHWIEFPNVSIVPDAPLPPSQPSRFGPIQEHTLDQAVDLDNGTVSEKSNGPMQKQGVDVVVDAAQLRVFEMDFVLLENADWDAIRPHELVARIYQNYYRPREVKPLREGQLPVTFGFRTREQNIGILQLLPPKAGALMRYKLIEPLDRPHAPGSPTTTASPLAAVANQPSLEAAQRAVKTTFAVTASELTEEPQLRFLAWQDEWKTSQPNGAWHPDGSPATNKSDLELLRKLLPSGMDVSATEAARRKPRFLHLWLSHPLLNLNGLNEVSFLDTNGARVKLGGDGSTAGRTIAAADRPDNIGWYLCTLSPGEGNQIPTKLTVRFRYAVGPLEREKEIPANYQGSMSLEGNSHLNGIGQDIEEKAFVAIAVDASRVASRHFGVSAITHDGRELAPTGSSGSGHTGAALRVQKFSFNAPLKEIAKFRIGTRPILTAEWKDVVLRQNGE